MKNRIANATEKIKCNAQLETRVKWDLSHSGPGPLLEQITVEGWKPIKFTSRFLNSCKER